MRYMIAKSEKGYSVFRKGDNGKPVGKPLALAQDRREARAKVRELRATEGKKATLYTQAEVQYATISPRFGDGEACANCRFFSGDSSWRPCTIVENWPELILSTGWCDEHERTPSRVPEPIPVTIVGERSMSEDPGVLKKGLATMLELFGLGKKEVEIGFKVLPSGEWFGLYSNNFPDRQNEAFASKAIDEFIAKVKSGEYPYPDLMFWHIKGTEVQGRATDLGRAGNYIWAKGTFTDDEVGQAFKAYYEKGGPWKMSHGFLYNPLKKSADGVYHEFRTFEVSVLPPHAAANPYTSFTGGLKMAEVTAEQKGHLIAALGAELGEQFARLASDSGKSIEAQVGAKSNEPVPEDVVQASKMLETLAQGQKTLTDSINVLTQTVLPMVETQKSVADRLAALEETQAAMKEFMELTPVPSKDKSTETSESDAETAFLKEKNKTQGHKSVLEMMIEGRIDPSQFQKADPLAGE